MESFEDNKKTRSRLIRSRLFIVTTGALSLTAILPLFLILFYIVANGASVIDWTFLTTAETPFDDPGGILHALSGSLLLLSIAFVLGIPVGIASGIYLAEQRTGRLIAAVRGLVEILHGVPSIIIGVVVYFWIVKTATGFSALSGGIALAILMLPSVTKSTEESLTLVPGELKEASLALGVPYYRTMFRVIIPAGMGGIVTGSLIGLSRVAGETAPLLFTAFGSTFVNMNIFKPVSALPLLIFNYSSGPMPAMHAAAWGAAFVLIVMILVFNISAKLLTGQWKTDS